MTSENNFPTPSFCQQNRFDLWYKILSKDLSLLRFYTLLLLAILAGCNQNSPSSSKNTNTSSPNNQINPPSQVSLKDNVNDYTKNKNNQQYSPEKEFEQSQSPSGVTSTNSAVPPGLTQEELLRITKSEDNKLYYQSRLRFEKLGAKTASAYVGKDVHNFQEFYVAQKEKLLKQRIKANYLAPSPVVEKERDEPMMVSSNSEEAELVVQYGDVDNLGFGWPPSFDPFSGASTPKHDYPFYPERDDPPGTDQILLGTGFSYENKDNRTAAKWDGYSRNSERPYNLPPTFNLIFPKPQFRIQRVLLQIMADDFQAPVYQTKFKVYLNGKEALNISELLNELKQGGPIGKLISFELDPSQIKLMETGNLSILIDAPETNSPDGFAVDFIRLLINPKKYPSAAVSGVVLHQKTKQPIANALVRLGGALETQTDQQGRFSCPSVPLGMMILQCNKEGFQPSKHTEDLTPTGIQNLKILLKPLQESDLEASLQEKGSFHLYGIYFNTDQATLLPSSKKSLQLLKDYLLKHPDQKLEIAGHTDNQGNEIRNKELSIQRSNAVKQWLVSEQLPTAHLIFSGYGAQFPIANNATPEGRALNRRVTIKLIK